MRSDGRIVVTGSVAFDYLMTFPGKFTEHLIPDKMSRLSVSFLVDEMRRVPGGCGPNIAYGLALLGERPFLLATAGADAAEYRERLAREGVDVSGLRLIDDLFTASFFVSTDQDQNQLASFYTGAMARARELPLTSIPPASIAFVVISPNDPPAMAAHAEACRQHGIPFLYDPSQQVTRLSGEEMRSGLRGAAILIVNDYEFGILGHKTGLSLEELQSEAPVVIVTHGAGRLRHPRPRGRARAGNPCHPGRACRERGRGPHGRGRHVPRGPPAGPAHRRPVAGGRPDRQHQRDLRPGGPGAPAAALHARRVPRALPAELRRRARAGPALRLAPSSQGVFGYNFLPSTRVVL